MGLQCPENIFREGQGKDNLGWGLQMAWTQSFPLGISSCLSLHPGGGARGTKRTLG